MHRDINFGSLARLCTEYSELDFQNVPKGLGFPDSCLWNEVIIKILES